LAIAAVVAPENPCSAKIASAALRSALSFSARTVGLRFRCAVRSPEMLSIGPSAGSKTCALRRRNDKRFAQGYVI
jgi:hypothetical protein